MPWHADCAILPVPKSPVDEGSILVACYQLLLVCCTPTNVAKSSVLCLIVIQPFVVAKPARVEKLIYNRLFFKLSFRKFKKLQLVVTYWLWLPIMTHLCHNERLVNSENDSTLECLRNTHSCRGDLCATVNQTPNRIEATPNIQIRGNKLSLY